MILKALNKKASLHLPIFLFSQVLGIFTFASSSVAAAHNANQIIVCDGQNFSEGFGGAIVIKSGDLILQISQNSRPLYDVYMGAAGIVAKIVDLSTNANLIASPYTDGSAWVVDDGSISFNNISFGTLVKYNVNDRKKPNWNDITFQMNQGGSYTGQFNPTSEVSFSPSDCSVEILANETKQFYPQVQAHIQPSYSLYMKYQLFGAGVLSARNVLRLDRVEVKDAYIGENPDVPWNDGFWLKSNDLWGFTSNPYTYVAAAALDAVTAYDFNIWADFSYKHLNSVAYGIDPVSGAPENAIANLNYEQVSPNRNSIPAPGSTGYMVAYDQRHMTTGNAVGFVFGMNQFQLVNSPLDCPTIYTASYPAGCPLFYAAAQSVPGFSPSPNLDLMTMIQFPSYQVGSITDQTYYLVLRKGLSPELQRTLSSLAPSLPTPRMIAPGATPEDIQNVSFMLSGVPANGGKATFHLGSLATPRPSP